MEGIQEGTHLFPPPYLAGYSKFERTRRLDGSAGITRSAIEARAVFWVAPTYLFDQMPVWVTAYALSGGPDPHSSSRGSGRINPYLR